MGSGLVLRNPGDHGPEFSFICRPPVTTAAPHDGIDPDLALLPRIARADPAACRSLVDRHLARLHALAERMLGSSADADEVCQDAFVRAWRQAGTWKPGQARFSTWLHQVVLNLCRDRLRTRRERAPLALLDEVASADDPERTHQALERSRAVRRALLALPERQREALLLCHYQGLSNIEAALVLELSVDALESLLARARRALRESLTKGADPLEGRTTWTR